MRSYMRYVFLSFPNQNMVMNGPSTARILTSLAPPESGQSQLCNDAKIIEIQAIEGRFVAMLWFWHIFDHFQFCEKIDKIRPKMHQNQNMVMNRPSIGRILTSLASLESWHSQLSNDAKIIINQPILMHFMTMFWFLAIFIPQNHQNVSNMLIFWSKKIGRKWPKIKMLPRNVLILVGWQ